MTASLLALPELKEIKVLLEMTQKDVIAELEQEPELVEGSKLIKEIVAIIHEKISTGKDLKKFSLKEQIDLAAHLSLLHSLLDELFAEDFDDEDFDFDDEDDFNDEDDLSDEDDK